MFPPVDWFDVSTAGKEMGGAEEGGVGGYWISRFTQHEIVADLIYRQDELRMPNVGALEAPNLES